MPSPRSRPDLVIALTSFSLVSLEVVWTRIFSAEFFYTFAFLALSLAVLGLGLGGLVVRMFPAWSRRLGWVLLATAGVALAGPPLVVHLGLKFSQILATWGMFARFGITVVVLGAPFFGGGIALTSLFKAGHADMPRLYRADLVGAALGAAGAVMLMNFAGTPAAAFLQLLPLLVGAFLWGGRGVRTATLVLGGVLLALLPFRWAMLTGPRKPIGPVLQRHWDGMALVKTIDLSDSEGEGIDLNIDNAANTSTPRLAGGWNAPGRAPQETSVPVKTLIARMNGGCRFLSLGAGAGGDVLQALQENAAEIHAVEVNPYINHLMKDGALLEYSGRIYQDPRVRVVTEDARTYVRRFQGKFDVIYSLSSNTFAALSSGAFALSENYLFTTEAFQEYLRALSPRGFLVMEHQFYIPRVVSVALEALRRAGVKDPASHIAVYALGGGRREVLLVGKQPLDRSLIRTAILDLDTVPFRQFHELYPEALPGADPLVGRVVREGWRPVSHDAHIDLSPTTDDRPFIGQMGLWRNLTWNSMKKMDDLEFRGFPLAKLLIAAILATVTLGVLPLNLLPALRKGPRLRPRAFFYFGAIGFAFMALEVVLIQKYALFIGASGTTVATILFTLLLGSGLGSRMAPKVGDSLPFLGILAWVLLEITVFGRLTALLAGLASPVRVGVSVALILPLGFFMGMPFPKGAQRVGELVDWSFAVNGAASVLGSCIILLTAFDFGFKWALLAGGAAYLVAMLLLKKEGWVTPSTR